jgi:hypothetical protein
MVAGLQSVILDEDDPDGRVDCVACLQPLLSESKPADVCALPCNHRLHRCVPCLHSSNGKSSWAGVFNTRCAANLFMCPASVCRLLQGLCEGLVFAWSFDMPSGRLSSILGHWSCAACSTCWVPPWWLREGKYSVSSYTVGGRAPARDHSDRR